MDKKSKVISNLIWRFFERFGAQAVSIVVSIILARKLGPGPAGDIAVIMAVITILKVFADSGMGNALIQKKDTDDLDYSSVFFFNLGFSLLLYAVLFLAAPAISRLYQEPSYVPILRVLGLLVVVSGLFNVQQAYVAKTLQFKRFFFATLGGTLFSAALSISMAYLGFGIWALVALQLSNFTVNTVILWFTVEWRPKRMFSFRRLKGLLSYGWKPPSWTRSISRSIPSSSARPIPRKPWGSSTRAATGPSRSPRASTPPSTRCCCRSSPRSRTTRHGSGT